MFSEPPGSYDICSICRWEDDHVQLEFPALRGGANKGSLKEYQDIILMKIPFEIKEYNGFKREPNWRPLHADEVKGAETIQSGLDYFQATGTQNPKYYWEANL